MYDNILESLKITQKKLEAFIATPESNVGFTKGMLQLIDSISKYSYVSIILNSTTLLAIGGRHVSTKVCQLEVLQQQT